ncbi:cobyrinate a,c-diamide synthase [Methanolobus halotolerans]|uniref:Cobyrinate a,c-diamide synthase n=1 Tax=Methanolobus halotolerans TaxID=2052935 RepID=A0A4E0PXE1_9EURY|nr:cobyrinate a,c-diamide synthase [Methanolobus halotolerans]TGC10888.1 cobyrinic acid a,c-diamide synthase [Methanolobus halotolerans]
MTKTVLLAGTNSGVGKTTVSMGIMAALKKRKMEVQPFKVGPDYIDPTYHTAICGKPSRNLDTYMMQVDGVKSTYARHSKDADINVIEGVMGLFDGMGASEVASSAHVAKSLGVPVILVINVHGMSRSAAALVKGFSEFDRNVNVAGVILNKVGSPRHSQMIIDAIPDIPVVGTLPRNQDVSVPSRHLGLFMAHEQDFDASQLAGFIEENIDLDAVISIAETAPKIEDVPVVENPSQDKVRIGIALDSAFCFYYQDMFDAFRQAGAEVVFFSPIKGEVPEVDGMYFGGGYPELHISELEGSKTTKSLKDLSADGMPVYGECGGLQYLSTSYEIEDTVYKMADLFPAETVMTKKLQALGYTEGTAKGDFIKGTIRGHEFHYSVTYCANDAKFIYEMKRGKGIENGMDCITEHNSLASYTHTHPASFPVKSFVDKCREYKRN